MRSFLVLAGLAPSSAIIAYGIVRGQLDAALLITVVTLGVFYSGRFYEAWSLLEEDGSEDDDSEDPQ